MIERMKRNDTFTIMTILTAGLLVAIMCFWYYLLRPLPEPEAWVRPGHMVLVDGMVHANPITKMGANPVSTQFYMTYVKEIEVNTQLERLTSKWQGYEKSSFTLDTLNRNAGDFTKHDLDALGKLLIPYMKHDIIKAAMTYSNIDWEETFTRPIVIYHPEKFHTGAPFHVGDEIIEINGEEIVSAEDISILLESYQVGDRIPVKVIRNGQDLELPIEIKELNSQGRATLGVYLMHRFTFRDLNEDDVIQLDENYSGESGGFMLTLGLIQQLNPTLDLSRGRKIAGTGGITRGGEIKPIGNLDMKVNTAILEGADIFFYPKFQEVEIPENHMHQRIDLVGVRNVADAMNYLMEKSPASKLDK
jgi:PDZ domain-containing protein